MVCHIDDVHVFILNLRAVLCVLIKRFGFVFVFSSLLFSSMQFVNIHEKKK